ncbi:hypothetical protein [Sphingomonas alpina]|uniref:hypothetical protein n=1 Tax=Sphingomonas alpina TaxID=653931 RepID=UPI001E34DD33|nr:hypothetical protein [Sphingomonas alpina]
MTASLIMALALQAAAVAPDVGPPRDWSALAPLPFTTQPDYPASLSSFVEDEVKAGHCVPPKRVDGLSQVDISLAVLIVPGGSVKRIVPQAIDCPTVEQYSAGLILKMSRDNIKASPATDTWYRTSMTFTWGK